MKPSIPFKEYVLLAEARLLFAFVMKMGVAPKIKSRAGKYFT